MPFETTNQQPYVNEGIFILRPVMGSLLGEKSPTLCFVDLRRVVRIDGVCRNKDCWTIVIEFQMHGDSTIWMEYGGIGSNAQKEPSYVTKNQFEELIEAWRACRGAQRERETS